MKVVGSLLARLLGSKPCELEAVYVAANGSMSAERPREAGRRLVVFPGSFNPLHSGHLQLAVAAQELCERERGLKADLLFEISVANADKGTISEEAALLRLAQFEAKGDLVLTRKAPLYVDKAKMFGPCDFIVGADTASRILNPKYYGPEGVQGTLKQIADLGCAFLVAGRFDPLTNAYVDAEKSLNDAPPGHRTMFYSLAESDFRCDISSTDLRRKQQRQEKNTSSSSFTT